MINDWSCIACGAIVNGNHPHRCNKRDIVGRDPGMGRVAFKTGAVLTKKDRIRNRRSKSAQRSLRQQIRGEE